MQLSRDTIVTAAMEILDSYGLADMTMRRVATHLGVAPGALYWHLATKQQLIAAIADRILAPALDPSTPGSPDSPAVLADRIRTALLAHRDGAELVSAALSQPDSATRGDVEKHLSDALALGDADISRVGAAALLHLVLGATTLEQAHRQYAQDTGTGTGPGGDAAEDFRRGVGYLLHGLGRG